MKPRHSPEQATGSPVVGATATAARPALPTAPGLATRQPLRLLFVLNSLCIGGAEKQVVSLLNRLDPATHEATLVLLKNDMALRSQIEPGRCRGGIVSLGVQRGLDWRAARALAQRMDDERSDIVVCTNMYAYLYAWLARRLSSRGRATKLVEVFHTTVPGNRKEALLMNLYRPLVRDADLLIWVCEAQATHWRARGLRARQDVAIHNGIDADHFAGFETPNGSAQGRADQRPGQTLRQRLGFGPDDLVVGVCAAMRPEKAHVDLLEAMARCRAGETTHSLSRPVRAVLIGDGPERRAIEQRIAALGLSGDVRLLGALQDVRPAIAACDLMAIPSRTVETFSIAALEAMAMARPMLMTDIGGARELVRPGETGWLVPAGDVAAMAATLTRIADPTQRPALRTMGHQAQRLVHNRFTVARMTEGYVRALEELARGGPTRPRTLHSASYGLKLRSGEPGKTISDPGR
jgi:glycosyltransferase involved in cell wall biosynthesis